MFIKYVNYVWLWSIHFNFQRYKIIIEISQKSCKASHSWKLRCGVWQLKQCSLQVAEEQERWRCRTNRRRKSVPCTSRRHRGGSVSRLIGGACLPRAGIGCSACGAIVCDSWLVRAAVVSCGGYSSVQFITAVVASRVIFTLSHVNLQ